jgi:hypothetical protein
MILNVLPQFFDVDTADIKTRLLRSVMVWKEQPFLSDESIKPDLYGPFWTATTLVFVLAVTSHVSSWMNFKGENWCVQRAVCSTRQHGVLTRLLPVCVLTCSGSTTSRQ